MQENFWSWVVLGILIVLVGIWLIYTGRRKKGIHRIFCTIPVQEEKMLHDACVGITQAATERGTQITKDNFEIIKKIYNETENNKLIRLVDLLFYKYVFPVLLSFAAFMLTQAVDKDTTAFIEIVKLLNPGMLAVLILLIAFIKMMSARGIISEEEIYRENITYDLYRGYIETHNIDTIDKKKKLQYRNFWQVEKWRIFFLIAFVLGVRQILLFFIPQLENILLNWWGIFVMFGLILAIICIDYVYRISKQDGLWDRIQVLYGIKDVEQCYQKIADEISEYNNKEQDSKKIEKNLSLIKAAIVKEKVLVVVMPIAFSVVAWFVGDGKVSLVELMAGGPDKVIQLILMMGSLLAVIVTLDEYPKIAFTEKVVEEMDNELKKSDSSVCKNALP